MVAEVCALFDMKKVNASGYHSLTNGVCIFFNRTLIQILVKCFVGYGQDRDKNLPYVICTMLNTVRISTRESPFFWYSLHPPFLTLDEYPLYLIDLNNYKTKQLKE